MAILDTILKPVICVIIILLASGPCSHAHASSRKRVLILNSYHQGFKWTDDETRGIISGLSEAGNDLDFHIEYMDAKRVSGQAYSEMLEATYRHKYRKLAFDVLVATDNDAFDFLRRHRDDIFGRVPVVFCGVNWLRDEDIRGLPLFTGVSEEADIPATLDVMLRLHPRTEKIYLVTDSSTTGRIVHDKLREIIHCYRGRVAFQFLGGASLEALLGTVATLPDKSLVLLTLLQQDQAGAHFDAGVSTAMLSQRSRVPVYGLWDFNLGFGIVGGKITSGFSQGSNAATLALRILRGESADSIPVIRKSPNQYMFDYRQLERFGIGDSRLPQGGLVINKPSAIYEIHRGLAWGIISGMGGLAAVAGILIVTILRRRRAEHALRLSEERFRTIFDSVNDAIFILDPAGGAILDVNRRMCEMYGHTREQACRLSIAELSANEPPYTMQDALEWIGKAAAEKAQLFEWLARAKGGRLFWVEVNMRAAPIDGQERLLVTVRDICKRKHSEERLAKLNDCFLGFGADPLRNIRSLTALCGELLGATCALYNRLDSGRLHTLGHWNIPPDFKLTDLAEGHICHDVIQAAEDRPTCIRNLPQTVYADSDPNVSSYDLQTYIGMPVRCNGNHVGSLCAIYQRDFSPEEEDLKLMGILASAIGVEEERRSVAEQLRLAHAELETRVRERTAELALANERLLTDIAERKRAEAALWKSESLLRKVFEAIPDMLSVVDRELRIVHSNRRFGYEETAAELPDALPYCYRTYFSGRDEPCNSCHAIEVFRTGMPVFTEKENPLLGMVEIRAYPVFDDTGAVIMVAEHVRDIADRKRLEEELLKAQKLESLGVLAGGIAHDFNNLLTAILGNISLSKLLIDNNDRAFHKLDAAEKAAARARGLTDQLLTFSKGGAPVKKTATMAQIVSESVAFVLRGSNVRCEYLIADDVWPVEVDEGQMNQVINNLIINADQAMAEGGIIRIRIENQSVAPNEIAPLKAGNYVVISIEDQGIGIPEELLQKIFDPYFTTKKKGSGLGLATAYSIIRNHDGYVRVQSQAGAGTTFWLYLPASEQPLPNKAAQAESRHAGAGKVLVMDDEEIIREVAGELLGHLGYRAVVCCDGAEAIALYQEAWQSDDPFLAVIIDLTIPGGMGGRETMKRLLEIDSQAHGIVSSGYCNDPILANHRDFGFRSVVTKPYSIEELGRTLQELRLHGDAPGR